MTDRRRARLRALANGVGGAGVIAHFVGWDTRWWGPLPVLTGRTEGLTPAWTRWYTPLLYVWAVAAVAAVVQDTDPQDRWWAAAGVATFPAIAAAGRRKQRWAEAQAAARRRWWNRALVSCVTAGGEAMPPRHDSHSANIDPAQREPYGRQ